MKESSWSPCKKTEFRRVLLQIGSAVGKIRYKYIHNNWYKAPDRLVYIDLNMVRAGVVNHPSEWPFCGYNEIQQPKKKNILINYKRLAELLGFRSYDEVRFYHRKWVDERLYNGNNVHNDKWTKSIAIGSKEFVEKLKSIMGAMAIGRKSKEVGDSYQLREPAGIYNAYFEAEKDDIAPRNTYLWDV